MGTYTDDDHETIPILTIRPSGIVLKQGERVFRRDPGAFSTGAYQERGDSRNGSPNLRRNNLISTRS
jgi:hypothetical protein